MPPTSLQQPPRCLPLLLRLPLLQKMSMPKCRGGGGDGGGEVGGNAGIRRVVAGAEEATGGEGDRLLRDLAMQTAARPNNSTPPSSRPSPPAYATMMSTPSSIRLATSFLRIATSLFLLISFHMILSGWGADGVTLRVVNMCTFPIWPAVAPNGGHPVLADGGFFLPPGQSRRVMAPWTWSGRLWARTGCDFPRRKRSCQTGDCQRRFACNGTTGEPPATLVEMTLQPDGRNYYDVSLVDGYNLPVSISASPDEAECFIGGCVGDPNMACPPELQVRDGRHGEVVACKSACLAFDMDEYCCRNEYASEDACRPSDYSRVFKKTCPHYHSYAYDSPRHLVRCASHVYIITFCPPMLGSNKPM
ncbi:hypothetical protein Taro_035353 [Colocasia esculenta]|uniref:Thaumatin-like protein n=1 Tax=Colocasia esculenta TaxID=4460 RepID=A0A843W3K5_COLES|nr:hypothetical protein [Colocasia esculenta]